jgi:putative sterol carrier protein
MALTYSTEEWQTAYREMVEESLAKAEKPYLMGSPEWVSAFEKLIQDDDNYKQVAKTWEGTVVIHMLAKPSVGLNNDLYILMDLWHGDCRSVRLVPREAGENADYVVTGELERWEAVLKKELDVVKAMMHGKVKLKGALPDIVRHIKATMRLVELAGQIDTIFYAQLSDQERLNFANLTDKLHSTFNI